MMWIFKNQMWNSTNSFRVLFHVRFWMRAYRCVCWVHCSVYSLNNKSWCDSSHREIKRSPANPKQPWLITVNWQIASWCRHENLCGRTCVCVCACLSFSLYDWWSYYTLPPKRNVWHAWALLWGSVSEVMQPASLQGVCKKSKRPN